MSSPSTRETLDGLDRAEYLRMSTRTQRKTVSPRLGDVFGSLPPRGEGEDPRQLNWDEVQVQNAELIEDATSGSQEASQNYRVAKISVSDWSEKRRDGFNGLRRRYRSQQKIMAGSCGPRGLALTGLDKPPVRGMLGLREQSALVHKRYEDPAMPGQLAAIPKAETSGPVLDLGLLAAELEQDLTTFEEAQNGWTEAKKVRDEAIVARKAARKRLRVVIANVARIQEGLYRLAGLDDLADRLRLTVRGPRSKQSKAKPPDDPSTNSVPSTDSDPSTDSVPSTDSAEPKAVSVEPTADLPVIGS